MLISSPQIDIPPDDPFKNDQLGRSEIEPPLTQLVTRSISSFVLSIDGAWGTGKTTFLDMWKAKLDQEQHICLKFNAWETDFASDPLIVLVKELSTKLKEISEALDPELVETLRGITGTIVKRSLPVGVKILTAGFLDSSEVEKEISKLTRSLAEDSIKAYEESYNAISEFRQTLNKVVQEISEDQNRKIIIIIDELDRCRPSYAIELLERIKHLFNIDGVVFILGIDRTQLAESVKVLYGSSFDASGYLKRFIDIDYSLPEPKQEYCPYLFERFGINQSISKINLQNKQEAIELLRDILQLLFRVAKFTLRDQIQAISRLSLVLNMIQKSETLFPQGLAILLFMREWNQKLYQSFIDGQIDQDKMLDHFDDILDNASKLSSDRDRTPHLGAYIEAILIIGSAEMNRDKNNEPIFPDRYYKYINDESSTDEKINHVKLYLESCLPNRSTPFKYRTLVGFESHQKHLELLNQFNDV